MSKDVVHVWQHFGNRRSAKASGRVAWPSGPGAYPLCYTDFLLGQCMRGSMRHSNEANFCLLPPFFLSLSIAHTYTCTHI